MKTVLLISQDQEVKDFIDKFNEVRDPLIDEIKELKKQLKEKSIQLDVLRKEFWKELQPLLEQKGYIKKDEEGEYPSLQIIRDLGIIAELDEKDQEEETFERLKEKLNEMLS